MNCDLILIKSINLNSHSSPRRCRGRIRPRALRAARNTPRKARSQARFKWAAWEGGQIQMIWFQCFDKHKWICGTARAKTRSVAPGCCQEDVLYGLMVGWGVLAMGRPRGAALWKGRAGWCHRHRGKRGACFLCSSHPARARGCNGLHCWGEEVKHQRSFGVQSYKTFASVNVLKRWTETNHLSYFLR